MTISLKHTFQSGISDGGDATLVQPSNWNAEHSISMATNKLVGRGTTGTGSPEEITLGSNLSLSATTLNVTIPLVFPFYKANGSLDTIALVGGTSLPFFNAAGSAKNIVLTT